MLRMFAIALIAWLAIGPLSAAEVGVQRHGALAIDFSNSICANWVAALVLPGAGKLDWSDPKLQASAHEAATPFADQCPKLRTLDLVEISNDGAVSAQRFMYGYPGRDRRGPFSLQRRLIRQLTIESRHLQQAFMTLERGMLAQAVKASAGWSDNPLSDRGYLASKLLYQEPGLSVYAGRSSQHPARAHRAWDTVFVHDLSDEQPIILVERRRPANGGALSLYMGRSEIDRYQRILDAVGPTIIDRYRTYHYVTGYQYPRDDRRKVMGPDAVETPLVVLNRELDWENRYVVSDEQPHLWFEGSLGQAKSINSVAHARKAFPAPVVPDLSEDPNVVAAATFEEIGLSLKQRRVVESSGDVTYNLWVSASTLLDADKVQGAQFVGINDASFWTLADLNEALKFVAPGDAIILDFYRGHKFTEQIAVQTANPERQVPSIQIGAPGQSYISEHSDLRAKAVEHGYVYKNENYWAKFVGADVRDIIDGRAGFIKPGSPMARIVLNDYVGAIQGQSCANRLGQDFGVFTITEVTQTFDGYGNTVSESARDLGTVKVPRRFVEIYGLQNGVVDDSFTLGEGLQAAVDLGVQANTPGGLRRMAAELGRHAKFVQELRQDMAILLQLESCDSPVLDQFEENFHRYLTGKKTVQEQPMSFAGSSDHTDPVFKPGDARQLEAACKAQFNFQQRYSDYCQCQSDYFADSLSDDVIRLGLRNYRLLESLVEGGLIGRDGMYMSMRRRCVT